MRLDPKEIKCPKCTRRTFFPSLTGNCTAKITKAKGRVGFVQIQCAHCGHRRMTSDWNQVERFVKAFGPIPEQPEIPGLPKRARASG